MEGGVANAGVKRLRRGGRPCCQARALRVVYPAPYRADPTIVSNSVFFIFSPFFSSLSLPPPPSPRALLTCICVCVCLYMRSCGRVLAAVSVSQCQSVPRAFRRRILCRCSVSVCALRSVSDAHTHALHTLHK